MAPLYSNCIPNKTILADNVHRNDIMNDVTEAELLFAAIEKSAARKSPGLDDLPKEFYLSW
jgi:hypothetical protein